MQTFKIRKVENLLVDPIHLDSKSCTFIHIDQIESKLFLPGFYHQDDRVKTIFRSDYPRNISRGRFAPRERCKFLFLDSWSASQKLFRYEDILEPVASHQIVSWVVFDHFWMQSVMLNMNILERFHVIRAEALNTLLCVCVCESADHCR